MCAGPPCPLPRSTAPQHSTPAPVLGSLQAGLWPFHALDCSQLGNRPFALYPSTLTLDHSLFSTNGLFKLCSESYPQPTSMHSAVPWGKTELYSDQDSTKQCLDTSALLRKSNGNSILRVPRTLSTPGT